MWARLTLLAIVPIGLYIGPVRMEETQVVEQAPTPAVSLHTTYDYAAPPTISRDHYIAIYAAQGSPAAPEAGAIYDTLVQAGIDPAVHAAQAMHETGLGTAGIGVPAYKNMHGVQCHAGDGRIADSGVPWGNGCAGVYASYTDAVATWARLIIREYVSEGLTTPALAVWKYAPPGADGNNPPAYIADMERHIDTWRSEEH